ncbi:MAG TPA: FAD-dependent oxidoreductase [Nocardioides sp.]|nr:FAD-dependent oxidoreductase [Nocardioides sp.]
MERIAARDMDTQKACGDTRQPIPGRSATVIVGGGLIGASTALHLARLGETDIVLLERNTIASGTSWHAAGLVASVRHTAAMTGLARYGVDFYSTLDAATGVDVSFNQCGSLILARTPGRSDELRHTDAIARQAHIETQLVSGSEVPRLWMLASAEGIDSALVQPLDGHLNPGLATVAMLNLAHDAGVEVRENVEVFAVRTADGAATAVETDQGPIECGRVVLACGLWTRDLAARCGANVPLYAAEHVHVRTTPLVGATPDLPVLRDLDGYFYVRHELGRLLVGAFEPDGRPRRVGEISSAGFAEFPADWPHFSAVQAEAELRVPSLRGIGYDRFLNAPEAFTPDGAFCLGETPEVKNLYVAAGFNSQGVTYAPGAGKALAEWIVTGSATFDAASVDVSRFARVQGNRRYLHERTREALGRLYAMHWPHLQPGTARNLRRTPLHRRLQEARAVFGEAAGWERANWFAPPGSRAEYEYSYGRQNWFEAVRREHRSARESAAVFDLSSFAKLVVTGPEALRLVQTVCTADVDMAVGRVKYTLMLNPNGGIELDGTVVRLAEDQFLVVTPTLAQTKSWSMFNRAAHGTQASVFDTTSGLATIAVMGPRSREILERISDENWSDVAHPYMHAREVEVGYGRALALRVSFVGELGFELYPSCDQALGLYDAILEAGDDLGLVQAGYHALDSLRCEKGYRHLGHDIGSADDPESAGLSFAVAMDKPGGFIGRPALVGRATGPARRTVFVALRDPQQILVHDETVLADGRQVGRMTSGSYGYTLGRACGIATIDAGVDLAAAFEVDCGGRVVAADVSSQPFYDPEGTRLRG